MYIVYYYLPNGKLEGLEKREGLRAPTKSFRYTSEGKLDEVSLIISSENTYIFKLNGKLEGHWIGNKCYDEKGNVVLESYR